MPADRAILVCGGAGYIGSQMCKVLGQAGITPIAFDNLSTGHRSAVRWGPLVCGDLLDQEAIGTVFREYRPDAVMHFAAKSIVAESVASPGLYFRNNVTGTLNLLDAMKLAGVKKLVFSSTAAVYGHPVSTPIIEQHPTSPVNPYGWSKLFAERMIDEQCRAHGLRAIALRYFNAAGADADCDLGEAHEPESHLVPNVLRSAMNGSAVDVYGNDYPTPDGTCVRDFVHVLDLCDAHLRAVERLADRPGFEAFNLGSGRGASVLEVIDACREVTGVDIAERHIARRHGDPPVLIASSEAARAHLGWTPRHTLRDCIAHAFRWESTKSAGVRAATP